MIREISAGKDKEFNINTNKEKNSKSYWTNVLKRLIKDFIKARDDGKRRLAITLLTNIRHLTVTHKIDPKSIYNPEFPKITAKEAKLLKHIDISLKKMGYTRNKEVDWLNLSQLKYENKNANSVIIYEIKQKWWMAFLGDTVVKSAKGLETLTEFIQELGGGNSREVSKALAKIQEQAFNNLEPHHRAWLHSLSGSVICSYFEFKKQLMQRLGLDPKDEAQWKLPEEWRHAWRQRVLTVPLANVARSRLLAMIQKS